MTIFNDNFLSTLFLVHTYCFILEELGELVTGLISVCISLPVVGHIVDMSQDNPQQLLRTKHHVLIRNKWSGHRRWSFLAPKMRLPVTGWKTASQNWFINPSLTVISFCVCVFFNLSKHFLIKRFPFINSAYWCRLTRDETLPADCDTHSQQCDGCQNVFHCKNVLIIDSQCDKDSQQGPSKKCNIFSNHSEQWWEETVHVFRCSLDKKKI